MFYPYDPKRLTMQDKEDAEQLYLELTRRGMTLNRMSFFDGFFCGIQNRDRQAAKRRMMELDEADESLI